MCIVRVRYCRYVEVYKITIPMFVQNCSVVQTFFLNDMLCLQATHYINSIIFYSLQISVVALHEAGQINLGIRNWQSNVSISFFSLSLCFRSSLVVGGMQFFKFLPDDEWNCENRNSFWVFHLIMLDTSAIRILLIIFEVTYIPSVEWHNLLGLLKLNYLKLLLAY